MPRTHDIALVKALLDRDRGWSAYAIGDLSPAYASSCEWYTSSDAAPGALLLVYRGFTPPIVFAMGDPRELAIVAQEIREPRIGLHLRPEGLSAIAASYTPAFTRPMLRMVLSGAAFTPRTGSGITPLDDSHVDAVTTLYEHGFRAGDGPAFFHPSMLAQRTFHGVWEAGELIAIAGTHLYSRDLGICAVGNVYTRADRRGAGLGAQVTSAVVTQALDAGISTVVLNVGRENPARRVYEALGFSVYCEFLEGEAVRVSA